MEVCMKENPSNKDETYAVEMLHITKTFPGIIANDDITLQVKKGEIHALLGENGAGKSTLMSVLFGLYQAEKGEIHINGEKVTINDPNDATRLHIGMVHQHFKLVQNFTVLDNIIMGVEPLAKNDWCNDKNENNCSKFKKVLHKIGRFFGKLFNYENENINRIIDRKAAAKRVNDLSAKYGLNIDVNAYIENITVGMQQRVEILKMLYRNNDILIFDEPTAVLTPQEITELMQIMRNLVKEGKSKGYWTLEGTFENGGNKYAGKWFDAKAESDANRIWEKEKADAIIGKCSGKAGSVEETTKPVLQKCAPLYDLTTLQREANNRFGFSAKTTLQIAQALYERHKLTTYPRTDSRALPEDYVPTVKKIMGTLTGSLGKFAEKALAENYVHKDPRIFDNSKISDHHALIPTGNAVKTLSEAEQKIYTMICQRFVAVFYPPAKFLNTTRITTVEGETFSTEGKILVEPGFKAIYGKDADEEATIPPLGADKKAKTIGIAENAETTKPPARYTESSLLSIMESAGKLVDDDDRRDAMKDRGLGTPANGNTSSPKCPRARSPAKPL